MELEQIKSVLTDSPTARLLRADSAAHVLDFLHQSFKQTHAGGSIDYAQDDLRLRLLVYQENLHAAEPDALVGPADRYLVTWSDSGWLRRFLPENATQPHYQLTQFTEDALRFVDASLSRRGRIVGTESRLRLVIETLDDVVRGSSADPNLRLQRLRAERQTIDDEIAAIESGCPVQTYRPAQIRERFHTAVDLLKTLQGDFRALEDRFAEIAAQVQREAVGKTRTRGEILADALDAEDLLKQQDEGISFYAFVAFLFSPDAQAALRQTIREVTQLTAISENREAIDHVRQMVPSLLVEADKVLRTTGRLSQTLRRLLDAESAEHRRRTAELLSDIRSLAAKLRDQVLQGGEAISEDIGLNVETSLGLASPMSRLPWIPAQAFEPTEILSHEIDLRDAQHQGRKLARLQRLELDHMRDLLRSTTADQPSITIAQLVQRRPPKAGVIELLGWLQIAHEDGHRIDTHASETVLIESDASDALGATRFQLKVIVPLVTFSAVDGKQTKRMRRKSPR
jgi:hypothetical protein